MDTKRRFRIYAAQLNGGYVDVVGDRLMDSAFAGLGDGSTVVRNGLLNVAVIPLGVLILDMGEFATPDADQLKNKGL